MVNFWGLLSLGRRPVTKAALPETLSEVPPAAAASSLLKGILDETATQGSPGPAATERAARPLSEQLSVGAQLANARSQLSEVAARLLPLCDAETARTIESLVEDLKSRACCIAFVGQVKAGKSTLINVLVEKPDLLPSGINPWTSVITRVHFGAAGRPQTGASFAFFSRNEWNRLSVGGKTRELTERLFPDFDWKALSDQVEAMQERARLKLGPRFEELLGTEHSYAEIEPGLLNRYVGAGHPDTDYPQSSGSEGEYSDLTKLADVFLDLGAFDFPTVLIDTPGINDPFLIRDEITRQNLEAADICVIMMTARQPLSTTDIGLLRMLRGLKKDRIVIFINKIDEVEGGEDVMREILHRVSAILEQEFPSSRIPVVSGSAHWALLSLGGPDPSETPGAADAAFDWLPSLELARSAPGKSYFAKSGLLALAEALSDMMRAGPVAEEIHAAKGLLQAIAHNLICWLETEIALLGTIPADASAAKAGLAELKALRAGLAHKFDVFSAELAEIRNQRLGELKQVLTGTAQSSITQSLASPGADAIGQASRIDAKARVALEGVLADAMTDASRQFAEAEERLGSELKQLFADSGLSHKPVVLLEKAPSLMPPLAALSEPAAIAIGTNFKDHTKEITESADLLPIFLAGFEPIIETLMRDIVRDMDGLTASRFGRLKILTFGPLDASIERLAKAVDEPDEAREWSSSGSQFAGEARHSARETIAGLRKLQESFEPASSLTSEEEFPAVTRRPAMTG